ncbi:MAG: response regulator [Phycisphaerae bacterium]|nr:response regulator [Phycisphaerae bacterium]
MAKALRILIVEDSDDDAQLLLRQLKRDGYDVASRRVETEADMAKALDGQAWDLVLSDYVMPRFSAPTALRVLQDKGLDLPFIIVSGAIGEEMAVAAMKAGAHDYIRKDNLTRLTAAIDRELREAVERRERRRLEKEILEVTSTEQRRIGVDLHDALGQDLTGIAFLSKLLYEKLASRAAPEAHDAADVGRRVNEAIRQVRALARGLCPVEPSQDGLMNALTSLAGSIEDVYGISCRFSCDQPIRLADNALATHLFQIAREAVGNAINHGKAKNVEIALSDADGRLTLRINDDGSGLPAALPRNRGMGLHAMNYRARMIGGVLAMETRPSGGTAISCSVRMNVE